MQMINLMKTKKISILPAILLFTWISFFTSCDKEMEGKLFVVSDEKMMDEIIESKLNLSSFLQIIDKSNMRGTVHAYGRYTLFVPTNEGVDAYLKGINKNLNDLTEDEAAQIVKYHLIALSEKDSLLYTSAFVEGRLPFPNFLGRYITTKTVNENSQVGIEVNRMAKIVEKDLVAANGCIHVVDQVLSHPTQTITDRVRALPAEQYSFFQDIFEQSGAAGSLSQEYNGIWYTLFIQDNQSYIDMGIDTIEDLLAHLRLKRPNVSNDNQLLSEYVLYHCAPQLAYVADLLMQSTINTVLDNRVIALKRDVDQVLLNEFNINGVLEPGVSLDRASEYTDFSCANGVIHRISGNIEIVDRSAYRVLFDLAEQPEIMALKGFRKAGTSASFAPGELSEVNWGGKAPFNIEYYCSGYPAVVTKDNNQVNGDRLSFRLSSTTTAYVEFKLPLLVEGKYKVWLGFRYINGTNDPLPEINTIFKQEGKDNQNLNITTVYYSNNPTTYGLTEHNQEFHERLLQDGQRQYCSSLFDTANACFLLGTIEVETTGRHWLRLEGMNTARFAPLWDVIEFIPVDDDQIWPKLDIRGKLIYQDTPDCEIWPYSECVTETPGGEIEE